MFKEHKEMWNTINCLFMKFYFLIFVEIKFLFSKLHIKKVKKNWTQSQYLWHSNDRSILCSVSLTKVLLLSLSSVAPHTSLQHSLNLKLSHLSWRRWLSKKTRRCSLMQTDLQNLTNFWIQREFRILISSLVKVIWWGQNHKRFVSS